ncbi:MAG: hypothetical protein U1E05_14640, partial [Patescibacteria group bacterium]|nr:hypothetical protein [Patescibacteria group bacterium]
MVRACFAAAAVWMGAFGATLGMAGDEGVLAVVTGDGSVQLTRGKAAIATMVAGLYNQHWVSADATADAKPPASDAKRRFRLTVPGGGMLTGTAEIAADGETLRARYEFVAAEDIQLNSLHVGAEFEIATLSGGRWTADQHSGVFPEEFDDVSLFHGMIRELSIELPAGGSLQWRFPEPTSVLLQDNRRWGPSFSVRMGCPGFGGRPLLKGMPASIAFSLDATGGVRVEHDLPVTITAGDQWIPLQLEQDILPGSALDFSVLGLQDAPAGKYGWLKAKADGTFVFENRPEEPVRFYGVNLCFSAHYITHEQADRLAERFARLGYNTVRLHHYEGELTESDADRTRLKADKLDQLDYLVAALYRRGIYVTTDLFVSRPVDVTRFTNRANESRRDAMNGFKVLAALNPDAYANWQAFTRNLLEHVNPYTKRAYKDEPGLAWLALINEGNLTNFVHLAKEIPDYIEAWNRWLVERYGSREELAKAWGAQLKPEEEPARGTVTLDGSIHGHDVRDRDLVLFFAKVEKDFLVRATRFLREELGVRALVTNMNGWTNHVTSQDVRAEMDYVDDHFYVDHPRFLERSWQLPSRCPNTSPVAGGATGGRHLAFTRLLDKPFTVSEYNYSGPGRYRGVGGILTGAMGALQGWDAIWRFAYSHSRDNMFQPGRLGYFDMATDPLSQAAERASICLFLRGDMRAAPHSVAVAMTPDDLRQPPSRIPSLAPGWHWAAWLTRVGTLVVADLNRPLPHDLVLPLGWAEAARGDSADAVERDPYQMSQEELVRLLRERGILAADNPTDPGKRVFQSETGEITIDGPKDCMILDTPRTAGGFACAGETISTSHGVSVAVYDTDATVWVSSLDARPIVGSQRLLVTHLTDLQNTEIHYGERARQTLLDWGKLPHLVNAGKAEVRVRLEAPGEYRVWALSTSGARLAEVPCHERPRRFGSRPMSPPCRITARFSATRSR